MKKVADDGGPADLGHVQLFSGQSSRDRSPAAGMLQDDRRCNGKTDENDAELDKVGNLIRDHAAEGRVEDGDEAGQQQADVQRDRRDQRVDNSTGSTDLRGGQAEQRQNAENCREVAGEFAEAAANDSGIVIAMVLRILGAK